VKIDAQNSHFKNPQLKNIDYGLHFSPQPITIKQLFSAFESFFEFFKKSHGLFPGVCFKFNSITKIKQSNKF